MKKNSILNRILQCGLFLLTVPTTASAQGGVPLLTDDASTIDKNHWEINLSSIMQRTTDEAVYEAPLLDINYGLIDHVQLNYQIPLAIRHEHESTTIGGIGKSNFGIKWNIFSEDSGAMAIGTFPQLIYINSNQAVDRGVVDKGTVFFLPVSFQKTVDKNSFVVQLGRLIVTHDRGLWTYGLLYVREISEAFELAAELNGSAAPALEEAETFVNIGTRIKFSKMFALLLSAGRNIIVHPDAENTFIGFVGLQTSF